MAGESWGEVGYATRGQMPHRELDTLTRLGEMTLAISRASSIEQIYREALSAVAGVTGAACASVLLFDPDGVMRFKAWLNLSEHYRATVEGHTPWKPGQRDVSPVLVEDVAREPSLARFLSVIEAEGIKAMAMIPLVADGGTIGKFMVYHPDQHRFATPELHAAGIVAAHTAFAIDRQRAITALQLTERRLWETQRQESLVTMAGGIAHDFNNVLMGVMGNASVALADLPKDSPACEPLEDVLTGAQRAAELTQQLLAYTGKAPFALAGVDLSALVRESARLLSTLITRRATLSLDCPVGLPEIVGDATQLRQIALNLLTNASDALSEHTGTITLRTRQLDVDAPLLARAIPGHAMTPGPAVAMSVKDSGVGMDEATLQRIFDPFFTTKSHGRGLGLASVLGIVRGHKGAILVDTAPGQGTTFTVVLPASASQSVAATTPRGPTGLKPHHTVLIVDDEPLVRSACVRMLERTGANLLVAEDGLRALEVLASCTVDAVLLDLLMPRLSGEELLAQLRRDRPGLPVVVSSGYSTEAARFAEAGVPFIQKPYTPEVLLDVLGRAVSAR